METAIVSLTLIAVILFCYFLAWYIVSDVAWGSWDFMDGFMFLFSGTVFAVIGFFIWFGLNYWITNTHYEQDPVPLKSLKTSDALQGSVSGGLFVVYGTFNEAPVYSFYAETAPGQFSLVRVNAEGSRIIESKGRPHVECETHVFTAPWFFGDSKAELNQPHRADHCDIYVPENSVAGDIDPNLG